jgi:FKBP-type peptidyl-prolyl cis-trans isomerase FkpA
MKMKKSALVFFLATVVLVICSAKGKSDPVLKEEPAAAQSAEAEISYAFGVVLGSDLKQTGLRFDYDALMRGLKASAEGLETDIALQDAITMIQIAYTQAVAQAMAALAEENKERETLFLAENGRKAGIVTTASGLQYEVIAEGTGSKPLQTDRILVNYEGTFLDGTIFDSSYAGGEPLEMTLTNVIPGWAEGLQLMREGGSYRLFIPSALAYGEQGVNNVIPPNAILIFTVELLSIVKQPPPPQNPPPAD